MDYGEPFGSVAHTVLTGLVEGAATATAFLIAGDFPVELAVFAAGIGLIRLVPALAHRFGGGSQSRSRNSPTRRRSWPQLSPTIRRNGTGFAPTGLAVQTSVRLPLPVTGRAYIIDGDTVIIRRQRVRLHGIDAPEMDQRGGAAARSHLFALIAGRSVTVIPIDIDIHGRTVARIEAAGTDLCRAMVADGFAIAYRRYSTAYVADERAARQGRRGLWAECAFTGIENPAAHRFKARNAALR